MADEYIRLDTTIIGIDSLINKAETAAEANELFKAKDVIYSQQRYTADIQPVKRGKMIAMSDEEKYRVYKDTARDYDGRCSLCNCCVYDTDIFCAECGAILQDADATKDEI